ncbi:serine hydrolase [bacterium]|nr:serine hydrolase [bacterium]
MSMSQCSSGACFLGASFAEDPAVASNIHLLEAWIETRLAYDNQPALNIAVVYDQELVWARSFGFADLDRKRPAALGDIYRIASQSKMFTAVAVMILQEEGRLRLDDPVVKYLPWFRMKNRWPDAPAVTVRHLLTHTGGIPSEAAFPSWNDFNFPEIEQIITALPGQETSYPSQTRWKYSNLGYALAGEIVSVVSGLPYADFIDRNILAPLNMTSTSVAISGQARQRLAQGYGRRMPDGTRAVMPFVELKGMNACGSFSSAVQDLARFASWQFRLLQTGGREILKASTLREMQRVHWLYPDWQAGWGLGFGISHTKERDIVFHGGWLPGYRSHFAVSPAEKIGVIVLQNTDDATTVVVDRAFEWLAPAILKAACPPQTQTQPDPAWDRFVGLYRAWTGDSQVLVHEGRLVMINPVNADPMATLYTLWPEGGNTFRMEGGGWGAHGELLTFETGPDGKVVRMKEGENYKYPVE